MFVIYEKCGFIKFLHADLNANFDVSKDKNSVKGFLNYILRLCLTITSVQELFTYNW